MRYKLLATFLDETCAHAQPTHLSFLFDEKYCQYLQPPLKIKYVGLKNQVRRRAFHLKSKRD